MMKNSNRNEEFHAGRFLLESLQRSGFGIEWLAEKTDKDEETLERLFAQPNMDAELFVSVGRHLGEAFFGPLDVASFGRQHTEAS